jgi:hypothetical protein
MICDCCRRHVERVTGSFWLGDARLCRECFARWCDPDNDLVWTPDFTSIGNYVRLKHGLAPLAATLVVLLAAITSTARASPRCPDYAEAAQIWPTPLAKDDDGCWTYTHHPPAAEAPASMPDITMLTPEPMLMDRRPHDNNLFWIELRKLEPQSVGAL